MAKNLRTVCFTCMFVLVFEKQYNLHAETNNKIGSRVVLSFRPEFTEITT